MAKEKEIKFKSYLNQDSIMLLKAAIATEQEEFAPFNIRRRRIAFDRATVSTFGETPIVNLSDEYGKEYMKHWNVNVGRLFCRDVRHNNDNKYYEMVTADIRAILRMVSQEELASKEFDRFDMVEYGGHMYVIIKIVDVNKNYMGSNINEVLTEAEEPVDEMSNETDFINGEGDAEYININDIEETYEDYD